MASINVLGASNSAITAPEVQLLCEQIKEITAQVSALQQKCVVAAVPKIDGIIIAAGAMHPIRTMNFAGTNSTSARQTRRPTNSGGKRWPR